MKRLVTLAATALVLVPAYGLATSTRCNDEYAAQQKQMQAKAETFPTLYAICQSLSIPKEKCVDSGQFIIGTASASQTNPDLWYSGTGSHPDDMGPVSDDWCYHAVAIGKYGIYDGSTGTHYACKVRPTDDHITDDEIARFTALAHRLNSISPKTLRDHEQALRLKNLVRAIGTEP